MTSMHIGTISPAHGSAARQWTACRRRSRGDRGREDRGVDRNRDDKTKGDDYRHLAELATRDAKCKAAEDTCVAYAEASKMQIIEHVVEVLQIQYQEVVRHVTVPQVVHTGGYQAGSRTQPFDQTVEQPYPVPQVMAQEIVAPVAWPYPSTWTFRTRIPSCRQWRRLWKSHRCSTLTGSLIFLL